MTNGGGENSSLAGDQRFLVLAPTGRDGPLTVSLLQRAGVVAETCPDVEALCRRTVEEGAAGLLIAEEVLIPGAFAKLRQLLLRQEPWSDIPILLFTGEKAPVTPRPPTSQMLAPLGNVTLLDRPLRPITMVSAARAALRARMRQYEARNELERQQLAVRQRDQFLAMLGHELRNPLSAILMAASGMGQPNVDRGRYLEILRRQAGHLSRLVDDLLDVSRVTSGRIVLQKIPLDLGELLRRSIQAFAASAQQQQLGLGYTPPRSKLRVHGDPVRLEQVFSNLVNNAIKYTPAGGSIEIMLESHKGHAVVRVRDTGAGIAQDMLTRVFDLFTQAESTLDRAKGGMGIGLTLVKSLVELHQGTVVATSEGVGKGSEFVVRLPLYMDASDALARGADGANGANGHTKSPAFEILIVEDNADSREILQLILERDGHHVDACGDGVSGVERALCRKPDLMVVDLGLPGLDGFGVAHQVRAQLGRDVYMIALTGYGQPEDKQRALEAGFDAHLTKPVDVDVINAVLREVRRGGSPAER
jgi:signal transduction histidine kinase/ActR/RegA family two-component response regulator